MPHERLQTIEREYEIMVTRTLVVADYYSGLARKYEWAGDHPWQSLSRDPPPAAGFDTLNTWLKEAFWKYGSTRHFPAPIPPDSRP
jgi:hypothetical protein